MSWRHPSRKRLAAWLESGEVDEGLEQHIESCDKCADDLEAIAAGESVDDAGAMARLDDALTAVLQPEPGLEERMRSRVAASLQNREDLALMMSVFGSGARTARLLIDPPEPT